MIYGKDKGTGEDVSVGCLRITVAEAESMAQNLLAFAERVSKGEGSPEEVRILPDIVKLLTGY